MDAVHFISPIKIGDMCILTASVNRSWRSSMEIGVLVQAENMLNGESRFCCYSILTFVAVMEGKPVPVPKIIPDTDEEKINHESAESRRLERIQSRQAGSEPMEITSPNTKSYYALSPNVTKFSISPTESTFIKENSEIQEDRKTKYASDSFTEIVQIIFPEHANSLGITFGGQIMKWMEYTAVMTASKHCRSHLLTASMDSLTFKKPTKVGDIVFIKGIVSAAFDHSVY